MANKLFITKKKWIFTDCINYKKWNKFWYWIFINKNGYYWFIVILLYL